MIRTDLRHVVVLLALLVAISPPPLASAQDKEPLGHEAYEIWKGIEDEAISRDGRWVLYRLTLQDGDPELVVRSLEDDREYRVPRATDARFDAAVEHVVALVQPAKEQVRQAKLDEVDPEEMPKASLAIVVLADGAETRVERVKSFALPEDEGAWVAYLMEKEPAAEESQQEEAEAVAEPEPAEEPPAEESAEEEEEEEEPKEPGTTLVFRDLASGQETRHELVTEYAAADDGSVLAYLTSSEDGSGDGAYRVAVDESGHADPVPMLEGKGVYSDLAVSETGGRVAFLSDRDTHSEEQPEFVLYRSDGGAAARVAWQGAEGLDADWWVSPERTPHLSESGERLFFGTAPRPEPEGDEEELLEEEKVEVDIWHWQDPLLQPMQLLQAEEEKKRTYLAVAHLDDGDRLVQLGDREMPEVELIDEGDGDGDYALGVTSLPYRKQVSWDFPFYSDQYLVDLRDGDRTMVAEAHQGPLEVSPDGRWSIWWDNEALAWIGRGLVAEDDAPPPDATNLTNAIRHAVHDEDHDWPYRPMPYGFAGWLPVPEDRHDEGASVDALIYDRYDVWAVDPAGERAPRHVTSGYGREQEIRLRYVRLDPETEWIEEESLLLSGLHEPTKEAGFWRVPPFGPEQPEPLVRQAKRFGRPDRAEDADVLLYTREDIEEFPDLWVAGPDFADARKISDANPQQSEYRWATAELATWRSLDGEVLQGLVHKPEDFDASRQYPMIVYFYERNADNLHQHHPPTPHRSVIRPTFYASRGYVVFTPDITYEVGYPGESAVEDVLSGVLHMVEKGYVDPDNIGVQGHSWGGYQIAYLVTETDIFKAAAGGAPVANMVSAYGGIRWGSGMSRMFQYERTQSRIGGSLWEVPLRYIESSPVFFADKVNTPLLMMHNDQDGAVPWTQGIEMFVALRRLGKPAWLVNYNDSPHWPTTFADRRDWNIRMQQYFDHYLKGASPPVWLQEGVPAVDKGETLGLELVEEPEADGGDGASVDPGAGARHRKDSCPRP